MRRLLHAAIAVAEVVLFVPAGLWLVATSWSILTGHWHTRR